jgi:predicted O-methyltransferase YrrM
LHRLTGVPTTGPVEIRPTRRDRILAREIYNRYKAKPGSEHIATETALVYLSACLREFRPGVVLECGAGIGTITDLVLSHPCRVERVISTEHNEFCLAALARNLQHRPGSPFSRQ